MLFDMIEKQEQTDAHVDDVSPAQHEGKREVAPIVKQNVPSINGGINAINFFDEKQLVAAEAFLTKVMRSKKGGIESVNDGLAVLMRAQDLQLPFSTCIEHIHVINGKTGVDIHIVKALLSRAGCVWRCLKDYQPLYEYTDGNSAYIDNKLPDYAIKCKNSQEAITLSEKDNGEHIYVYPVKYYQDVNGNMYKDYQLNAKQFGIAVNKQQAVTIQQSGKIAVFRVPNQPADYMTEYEFQRVRKIHGELIKTSCISSFTYLEALAAGCFEKDTYKKYPKVMVSHRAFTYGARDIASDVLFGVMETTELKQVNNIDLSNEDVIEI